MCRRDGRCVAAQVCGGDAAQRHDLQLLRTAAAASAAVRLCAAMAHLDAAPPHLQPPQRAAGDAGNQPCGLAANARAAVGQLVTVSLGLERSVL